MSAVEDRRYAAPDGGPPLLLSAKGMNPDTADDYTCDHPGCDQRATHYLFLGPQWCPDHPSLIRGRAV